jgi:hypothetical protein
MIASAEYARLLGVASKRFLERKLGFEDGANGMLLGELQFLGKISKVERRRLNEVWEIRKQSGSRARTAAHGDGSQRND